ncbi:aquaporin-10 isoform 3-T3 [Morphnus guianensis]
MCLLEQFPWWKLPIFVAVQTSGAFISAGAVYALYYDAIQRYSNGTLTTSGPWETASIFATYPADYLSLSNGFLDQVGAGAGSPQTPPALPVPVALSFPASPTGDGHSAADRGHPGHSGHPQQGCPQGPGASGRGPAGVLHRGLHGLQLRLPHEPRTGFRAPALHLRRGLGRRGLQVGRGKEVRWRVAGVTPCPPCPIPSRGNGWWWVPVVAPLLGAAVGSALYQLLVAFHHPLEEGDPPAEQTSRVLVNVTIPPDTDMSPGEKDAGGMLPQKK